MEAGLQIRRWIDRAGAQGPLVHQPWQRDGDYDIQSGETIEGKLFHGGEWVGLHHGQGERLVDFTMTNCMLMLARIWISRLYEVQRMVQFKNVTFNGVRNEHGLYANLVGVGREPDVATPAMIFDRCLFENITSQPLQLFGATTRMGETKLPPMLADSEGGPIIVRNSVFRTNGMIVPPVGRAAHNLSFRTSKNHVRVENVLIDNRALAQNTGALLCQGLPGWDRHIEIVRAMILLTNTNRPALQFEDMASTTLRDCVVIVQGGQPWIEHRNQRGAIRYEGCRGNVTVRRDGVDIGHIRNNPVVGP